MKYNNNMKKCMNLCGRVLCAFLLCLGVIVNSCDDGGGTDLDVFSNSNLSRYGTANCYIVSKSGDYKFRTVKGNTSVSVGTIESVEVLWESFGTDVTPNIGDLVKDVQYADGYIVFQTPDVLKEGNAVIAAKDTDGVILWSWHLWFTDEPRGQFYYNNAGIMMDRNLGATSATPGDVGAMGLLYQWGRKDPFIGSSSIIDSTFAKSTVIWPEAVQSNSNNGTIEYSIAHPTTFIAGDDIRGDWCYMGSQFVDDSRWTELDQVKSVYDPCPPGWRVPDGDKNSVWGKAVASSLDYSEESLYDNINEGINFSGVFGPDKTIWYPSASCRNPIDGSLLYVGCGNLWSAYSFPLSIGAFSIGYNRMNLVDLSDYTPWAYGLSVRCVRE